MEIDRLDHLVLTVRDVAATCDFYQRVLGMQPIPFGDGRFALHFGRQKINLHPAGAPIAPHALHPTPGSADLCFIAAAKDISKVIEHLTREGIKITAGPVARTGATGPIMSIYFCDPDENMIEVSVYEEIRNHLPSTAATPPTIECGDAVREDPTA